MARKKLTSEQHSEIGKQLAEMNNNLGSIAVVISNTYGSSSRISREAHKLLDQFLKLRNDLDDQASADYPERSDKEVVGYYF